MLHSSYFTIHFNHLLASDWSEGVAFFFFSVQLPRLHFVLNSRVRDKKNAWLHGKICSSKIYGNHIEEDVWPVSEKSKTSCHSAPSNSVDSE